MLPLDKIFSGKTPPSSGGLNQVVFGTFIKSFMLPIRRALPWKLPGKDDSGSMLSKISVRGDGSPRDMVFHASKPSTGMGFRGSNVPPNYKIKQSITTSSQLNRQITQMAQTNACVRLNKNVRTLNLLQKQKSVRMSLARVSRACARSVLDGNRK